MGVVEIITLVLGFVLKWVLPAIGGTAIAATVTPNVAKSGNPVAQLVLDAINFGGGNLGQAANK
jgi:hypothetical protein